MRTKILALLLSLLPSFAMAQSAPANLPAQTVYGRLGVPGDTGPGQAIPFTSLPFTQVGIQPPNTVYSGPSSGISAAPSFRSLVAADLPSLFSTMVGYTAPFTGAVAETQSAYNSQRLSVMDFGAKCDGTGISATVSITSGQPNLTATGVTFTSADVGKAIAVGGAGSAGAPLITTILAFVDATHVTLNANASTTVTTTSKLIFYGTDDTVALQAAANVGQIVGLPAKTTQCFITGAITFSIAGTGFVGAAGWDNSTILSLSLTANILQVNGSINLMTFKNLSLFRTIDMSPSISVGAVGLSFLGNTEETTVDNIHTRWNGIGIQLGSTAYSSATNLFSERNNNHGIVVTDSAASVSLQWQVAHWLSQNSAGWGVLVTTGNNAVQYSVETWYDVKTFANSTGGIGLLAGASSPIQSFRLIGGFLGQDGGDEIKFDTHDSSGHFVSDTFIELAGTLATGPLGGTAPSGVGRAVNITANNTAVTLINVIGVGNSQDGVNTSASVLTQIIGSSLLTNGGWGVLAADGSKVSINSSRTSGNTSGACSFTTNGSQHIGVGNTPNNSSCNAAGQVPGTATNDSANAGNVGEFISSTVVVGSAISLTNNTPVNVTSISLTSGDWDIWFECTFGGASTTVPLNQYASISTTTATLNTTPGNYGSGMGGQNYGNTAFGYTVTGGPARVSLSATTTVFGVAQSGFTTSTSNAYGILRARRVR